jgi:hypothetical protein
VRAPQPSGGVTEAVRASLRTDARAYVARHAGGVGNEAEYRFTVIATFTNTGPHAISLARCLPTDAVPIHAVWHADHTTGGPADEGTRAANLPAYSPRWGCRGGSPPFVVAPGATRVDTLRLRGPWGWDAASGRPRGAFEGRMRLLYEVDPCADLPDCEAVPARIASSAFAVTREPLSERDAP